MNWLLRIAAVILALALLAAPVVAVRMGVIGADRWPIQKLRVTSKMQYVDAAQLRKTLAPFAAQGFFGVDLDGAQSQVERLPWVERAEVRKKWPNVLEVAITEDPPLARWGDDRLLSRSLKLFPRKGIRFPANLPQMDGNPLDVRKVVDLYNASNELFGRIRVPIEKVQMSDRGSFTLDLVNGTHVIAGRNEARARLSRFVTIYPQLVSGSKALPRTVDLRYTNGFAMSWMAPTSAFALPATAATAAAIATKESQ